MRALARQLKTVLTPPANLSQQLTIRSSAEKNTPNYKLKVTYTAPKTGKKWEDKEVTGKFTQWFNSYGYLQRKEFHQWLTSNIDVLRTAEEDLTRKEKTADRVPVMMPAVSMDQSKSLAATGIDATSPVTASAKKGRSKKKV
jgi:hypothetical protein